MQAAEENHHFPQSGSHSGLLPELEKQAEHKQHLTDRASRSTKTRSARELEGRRRLRGGFEAGLEERAERSAVSVSTEWGINKACFGREDASLNS